MKKLIFLLVFFFQVSFLIYAVPADVENISNENYSPAVLKAIQSAQKSIYVCMYYISYSPKMENKVTEILNALVAASKRGVKVEVILDRGNGGGDSEDALSNKNDRAYTFLKKSGIPVFYDDIETITHAKYFIIDEQTVILGSFNLSENALNSNREAGVLIQSPDLVKDFFAHYCAILNDSRIKKSVDNSFSGNSQFPKHNAQLMQCDVSDISNDKYFSALLEAIKSAKKSISVCMYLIALSKDGKGRTEQILDALIKASKRGVKVEVILDRGFESMGNDDLSKKNLKAFSFLKQSGVPVFYDDAKVTTHAKYFIIDESTVILGSFNLSDTSLTSSREAGVLIRSAGMAESFKAKYLEIPKYTPEAVKGAIPIPMEFMTNPSLAEKMVNKGNEYVPIFYLLVQKLSYERKSKSLEIEEKLIFDNFYKGKDIKFGRSSIIGYFVKSCLRYLVKEYPFIKAYRNLEGKKALYVELDRENSGRDDSLWISKLFWEDGWSFRLNTASIFCYFITLDRTDSGRVGRYFSEELWKMSEQYKMDTHVFSRGFDKLQWYNLIEKEINYKIGEQNPNGYILNDFYRYEDFLKALDKLKSETEPELFKTVMEIADLVNEASELKCVKELISLGKKYGLKVMKDSLTEMKKHQTHSVSLYKRYGYVVAMVKIKGEGNKCSSNGIQSPPSVEP